MYSSIFRVSTLVVRNAVGLVVTWDDVRLLSVQTRLFALQLRLVSPSPRFLADQMFRLHQHSDGLNAISAGFSILSWWRELDGVPDRAVEFMDVAHVEGWRGKERNQPKKLRIEQEHGSTP